MGDRDRTPLGDFLIAKRGNASQAEVAKRTGGKVAASTIAKYEGAMRGQRMKPKRDHMLLLARALDLDHADRVELLTLAGVDEPSDHRANKDRPTFEQLVRTDSLLTSSEKDLLVLQYQHFVGRRAGQR